MTDPQLSLDSDEPRPITPALTERQQLALQAITTAGPQGVTSDELGAILHEDRRARGGRGHDRDERCDWCTSEGRQVGEALRTRGLVYKARNRDWTLVEHRGTKAQPERDSYDPRTAEIPF